MHTPGHNHRFEEIYKAKTPPWDIGRPDSNLTDIVTKTPIEAGKALEIGCGYGHNSMWLASQGFSVTGVDVSESAIQEAKDNASKESADCSFIAMDFMENDVADYPFSFVFDRGCFHAFRSEDERRKFADRVAYHLGEDGLWFSLIGNADGPSPGPNPNAGPPKLSAKDIVIAVEPVFEIISLKSGHFETNRQFQPRAWACLMKKR
jgi:SAM-dependent methyltransferase